MATEKGMETGSEGALLQGFDDIKTHGIRAGDPDLARRARELKTGDNERGMIARFSFKTCDACKQRDECHRAQACFIGARRARDNERRDLIERCREAIAPIDPDLARRARELLEPISAAELPKTITRSTVDNPASFDPCPPALVTALNDLGADLDDLGALQKDLDEYADLRAHAVAHFKPWRGSESDRQSAAARAESAGDVKPSDRITPDPLLRLFNPKCAHDRASYDVMQCPECAAYTSQHWADRIDIGTTESSE